MLTETEVAFRLGLKPWQQFEDEAKENGFYPRRSGRTTRMLVKAVAAAQHETVAIAAYTGHLARFHAREARQMCARLGIDPKNIVEWSKTTTLTTFSDHWAGPKYPDS